MPSAKVSPPSDVTGTVSRQDGGSWFDSGFNVGDRVQLAGTGSTTWAIVEVDKHDLPTPQESAKASAEWITRVAAA